jgi:hypothetical protein
MTNETIQKTSKLFQQISATLNIDMPEGAIYQLNPTLLNEFSKPDAIPISISIPVDRIHVFDSEAHELRSITSKELESNGYNKSTLKIRHVNSDKIASFTAENGEWFTIKELIKAVEKVEQEDRVRSDWFGGVDVHHVFFEGIHFDKDSGVGYICWGS